MMGHKDGKQPIILDACRTLEKKFPAHVWTFTAIRLAAMSGRLVLINDSRVEETLYNEMMVTRPLVARFGACEIIIKVEATR
jgi:hypothetical protein